MAIGANGRSTVHARRDVGAARRHDLVPVPIPLLQMGVLSVCWATAVDPRISRKLKRVTHKHVQVSEDSKFIQIILTSKGPSPNCG